MASRPTIARSGDMDRLDDQVKFQRAAEKVLMYGTGLICVGFVMGGFNGMVAAMSTAVALGTSGALLYAGYHSLKRFAHNSFGKSSWRSSTRKD